MQNDSTLHEEVVIRADGGVDRFWRDAWAYRELLLFLIWRDILVRYKQTVIGAAWVLLRPLLTVLVFTLVFSRIAGLPSAVPYPLLVLSGLLPWLMFATALQDASTSLVSNQNMVGKVYFPRMFLPISAAVQSGVDMLVAGLLLVAVFLWYGHAPDLRILAVAALFPLTLMAAAGAGILFAALNARYRDFRYIIPFVVQIGFFVSPVGYSGSLVPPEFSFWYFLNPMASLIEGWRWALLGGEAAIRLDAFIVSQVLSMALFVYAIVHFRKVDRTLADVI